MEDHGSDTLNWAHNAKSTLNLFCKLSAPGNTSAKQVLMKDDPLKLQSHPSYDHDDRCRFNTNNTFANSRWASTLAHPAA